MPDQSQPPTGTVPFPYGQIAVGLGRVPCGTTLSVPVASGRGCVSSRSSPAGEERGEGWQTRSFGPAVGVHLRGPGPGDSFSLPYFEVEDLSAALEQIQVLGGSVVHPGEAWAVCKDSEGSPFGLAARAPGVDG